jgi:iron(III) transport system substrate-binding protein
LVVVLRRESGWSYFEKLAKNNPRIGRSGGGPLTMLNAGECVVGTSAASIALQSAAHGNPIGLVFPEDGSLPCVGSSAILAAAPHPNAARLFQEWLLSADCSQACVDNFIMPVRTDSPPPKGGKRPHETEIWTMTTAEIAKGIPEVVEEWRDTFGS